MLVKIRLENDKEILDNAKEIILKYRDVPGGMEIIRETMNNVYRYFKRTISEATVKVVLVVCILSWSCFISILI